MIPIPFFLFWESEKVVDLGPFETVHCEGCIKDVSYHLLLRYRLLRFSYLFGLAIEKRYSLKCPDCHDGWELDAAPPQGVPKNAIPFMHRYGVFFAPIFVILLLVVFHFLDVD